MSGATLSAVTDATYRQADDGATGTRAFTVYAPVAFDGGEYDLSSPRSQDVLALFEKMCDAGTGEALKLATTRAGKQSGLPFGQLMGSLSGAALQAIYNNRQQVLEALGLKSGSTLDETRETESNNRPDRVPGPEVM